MLGNECYNELRDAFYAGRCSLTGSIHDGRESDLYDCRNDDYDDDDADCFCG